MCPSLHRNSTASLGGWGGKGGGGVKRERGRKRGE